MQIEEALDRFLVQLEADGRSVHTRKQYSRHVRALALWLLQRGHGALLGEVRHEDVARFLASTAARTRPDGAAKRPGSRNALGSSLKGFFGYCHRARYVHEDASRLVRRTRAEPPPPRGLSSAEQMRLLASVDGTTRGEARRDGVLIRLMLTTGLRLSSALALDVPDVDVERGELRVRRLKGGGEQVAPIPDTMRDRLVAYVEERTAGPLFLGCTGRRLGNRQAQRRFAQWLEHAGLAGRYSAHSLRHAFAMGLYQRTGDVLLVREALGHRSISSTMVYARCDNERLRQAVGALERSCVAPPS